MLAALDEPILLQPLEHLAGRRARDAEHLGHPRRKRRQPGLLRPAAIIRDLDLRRPIYAKTAAYGHFGRDDHDFTWERTDKAGALREAAGIAARTTA